VLLIYAVGIAIVAGAIMLVLPTVIAQAKGLPALLQTVENQLWQHGISVSISSLIKAVNGQQLGVALGVAAAFVSGLVSVVLVVVISIICSSRGVRSWRRRATSFRTGSASSTLLR
jgi:predicted PurR-regulated permease PerM